MGNKIFSLESFLAPHKGKKYSEIQTLNRKINNKSGQWALDLDMVTRTHGLQFLNSEQKVIWDMRL